MHRTIFLLLLGVAILGITCWSFNNSMTIDKGKKYKTAIKSKRLSSDALHTLVRARVIEKAHQLQQYARQYGFDDRYCLLADMLQPSGNFRFFIFDLEEDAIVKQGLVAHGIGSVIDAPVLRFSNTPGSYCTSLGKYKIGKSYNGTFGLAFKLYGLDPTNSNAYSRSVVLHSYPSVPDYPITPGSMVLSQGCPTVSKSMLTAIQQLTNKTTKPILLDIFY